MGIGGMISLETLKAHLADFPRVELTYLPTPLKRIERWPRDSGSVNLFLKRDDLTGLGFGGNKARKLEFIVADALKRGADTIVTWGGIQSNWCLQTALAAARVGLQSVLVLLKKPGASAEFDGNLLLDRLCGADIKVIEVDSDRGFLELADVADLVEPVVAEAQTAGKNPYLVPIGGSIVEGSMDRPYGAMGYADALVEVLEQAGERGLRIDSIVHASGSAGTQAGLLAAAKAVAPETRVVGISVTADRETLSMHVKTIATGLIDTLALDVELEDENVIVLDGYLGEGYGVLTPEISRGIADLARSEGVFLDPVYTGKAWIGLMDLIETGYLTNDENVLFIHTGGTPALFPYRQRLTQLLDD